MSVSDLTPGSRWREKSTGAVAVIVEEKDDGMAVWCRWEASGELFQCDGLDFRLWNRFAPVDAGRTW